ncbi:MAG: hypothetical protein R3F43_11795 [bacterium]
MLVNDGTRPQLLRIRTPRPEVQPGRAGVGADPAARLSPALFGPAGLILDPGRAMSARPDMAGGDAPPP